MGWPRSVGFEKFTGLVHRRSNEEAAQWGGADGTDRVRGSLGVDGVAGQGEGLRWRWGWGKALEGELMLPEMSGGVKAGVAHGVLAFRGSVPEHAGDEFGGGECEVFALGIGVVEVGEGDGVAREVQAAVRAEGAALDVACEVDCHAPAVGIGLVDLDIPVSVPLQVDDRLPVRAVLEWR